MIDNGNKHYTLRLLEQHETLYCTEIKAVGIL